MLYYCSIIYCCNSKGILDFGTCRKSMGKNDFMKPINQAIVIWTFYLLI